MPLDISGDTGLAGAVTGALNGTLGSTTSNTIAATTVSATTITASGLVGTSATGALILPSGTTAERPAGVAGQYRYNTDLAVLEFYNGSAWYSVTRNPSPTPTVEYLVVAGGGAGGYGAGSGNNAGGCSDF